MTIAQIPQGEHRRRRRGQSRPDTYRPWNKGHKPADEQLQTDDWAQHYFLLHNSRGEFPPDFDEWVTALAYIRVSSDDQADMYGPDVQRRRIAEYCRASHIRITDEFFDSDSGDLPLSARPEGAALLKSLKLKRAKTIITLCLDRLARNEADAHASYRAFRYQGVELHFAKRGKQTDDVTGKLLFGIEATMASVEREVIRERTMGGTVQKAKDGQWVGLAVPYGYNRHGRGKETTLVPDPATAPVVRMIFDWYVLGDGKEPPMSMMAISRRLRDLGIPRPGARYDGDTSNCKWEKAMVHRILLNSTYRGIYQHGRRITLPKEYDTQPYEERRAYRRAEDIIEVRLSDETIIVPNQLWEATQERLAFNAEMKNRQREGRTHYLLSGFLKCPHCGRRMSGHKFNAKARQRKTDRLVYWCLDPDRACPAAYKQIGCDGVDDAIVAIMLHEMSSDRLEQNLAYLRAQREDDTANTEGRVADLQASITAEKKRLDRLIAQMARFDDEDVIEGYQRQINDSQRKLKGFKEALARAQATLERIELTEQQENVVLEMACALRDRLNAQPTVDQVRGILSALKVEITLDLVAKPAVISIKWALGPEGVCILLRPQEHKLDQVTTRGGEVVQVMPNWLGIYWAGHLQNGIHALPILSNGTRLWDGLLGTRVSFGCVILGIWEAQTLYDWAEVGTPVNIQS